MKKFTKLMFLLFINILIAQRPFITKWNTNANNDGSKQLNIGLRGNYNYSFINLNDNSINGNASGQGSLSLNFPVGGIYMISVTPLNELGFKAEVNNQLDANKLIDVIQWGDIKWEANLSEMFKNCKNITTFSAFDKPNLSTVEDLSNMFFNAVNFNSSIENWDVSNIKNMSAMFSGAASFNQGLRYWNTANVTNMSAMFSGATSFNQPIGNWNTANVTNMSAMFSGATRFNQQLNWNTTKVSDMSYMFNNAVSFNQQLPWNTNNVIDMSYMFNNAVNFNQDLGNFSIANVKSIAFMIDNVGLNCENYSSTLKKWSISNSPYNLKTRASNLIYNSEGKLHRDNLINNKKWEIGGDTYDPYCSEPTLNIDDELKNKIKIYPNPVKDKVIIESDDKIKSIAVFSYDGKLLTEVKEQNSVNLSQFPVGNYLLKIIFKSGKSTSKKIIKK